MWLSTWFSSLDVFFISLRVDDLGITINNKFITILSAGDISILFANSNFIYYKNSICTYSQSTTNKMQNFSIYLSL